MPIRPRAPLAALAALLFALPLLGCEDPFEQNGGFLNSDFDPSLGLDVMQMTADPSGILYLDLEPTADTIAMSGDTVDVTYEGWLAADGSSFGAGPFQFTLGAMEAIDGFDAGIAGMSLGATRLLVIPPELAYGVDGRPNIPPNSILVFIVTLDGITPPP